MNIENRHICFACAFSAIYGGNFIRMLKALSDDLTQRYGNSIFFIFPQQENKHWIEDLRQKYTVGFTTTDYHICQNEIKNFIEDWKIDIIHTHFEAYDISVAKAVKVSKNKVQMVWHLHDYLSLDKTGLSYPHIRKFFTNQRLWKQYGKWGKDAYFIGVSAEVTNIATHYRSHHFSYPPIYDNDTLLNMQFSRADVIINGIDLKRLKNYKDYDFPNGIPVFLSFGGESISKGIPTILEAAELLAASGEKFLIRITKGYSIDKVLTQRYPENLPLWLEIVPQTEDISSLFQSSNCYISASLKETMSMAIAEASIVGLPIIQSDIPGTWWNSSNPSTFIFKVGDSHALAKRMAEIIHFDKKRLKILCNESRQNNIIKLNMSDWCKKIIDVYMKI